MPEPPDDALRNAQENRTLGLRAIDTTDRAPEDAARSIAQLVQDVEKQQQHGCPTMTRYSAAWPDVPWLLRLPELTRYQARLYARIPMVHRRDHDRRAGALGTRKVPVACTRQCQDAP